MSPVLFVVIAIGVVAFFAQHEWLVVVLVVVVLAVLGVFVRFANVLIREIEKKTYWDWREERERFLDSRVIHREGRQMRSLEGEQQRREYKRRGQSWWDQLKLFR